MKRLLVACCLLALPAGFLAAEDENALEAARSEQRLFETVRFLASDELQGRGVGTPGLNVAADYIARQFADLGLQTHLFDDGPFQKFEMVTSTELGRNNHLTLVAPATAERPEGQKIDLKLGGDFNPLALGDSGVLDVPLVFVGYGISGKDEQYDDYAGIDVEGKAVIILRHEPQQANPHSVFEGTKHSVHAPFLRKLANAREHGAAAVLFCSDEYDLREKASQRWKPLREAVDEMAVKTDELTAAGEQFRSLPAPSEAQRAAYDEQRVKLLDDIRKRSHDLRSEYDPVLRFAEAGSSTEPSRVPVAYCRRSVIERAVKQALGEDLGQIERDIDNDLKPHSRELSGWRLTGEVSVERRQAEVKNVVAMLEGSGPLADETIVVGAHYDHLGMGGEGSLAPGVKDIHNGADDNGSGTAALIEVARLLASRGAKLPRRVLFIAFTGEERGLVGSARYCKHPLVSLDKTIAMLNMDMVGRLDGDKLIIQGVDTAPEFGPIIDEVNAHFGFKLTRQSGGFGPSDHASFYAKKVPVMHFFTGTHKDYHRPSDDYDKLNVPGMRRVAEMVAETVEQVAEAPQRPQYVEVKSTAGRGGGGDRPYFGSIPDFASDQQGYALSGVSHGGPAEKAGLQEGDVIVRFGDSKITNLEDFDSALRKFKAGDKVPVVVKRGDAEVTLEVVLEPPR